MFRRKVKTYSVTWRHPRLDTPDFAYRGSGLAYGKNPRQALDAYFDPRFVQGDQTHKWAIWAHYKAGALEVTIKELT